jgi:hypothetical protein
VLIFRAVGFFSPPSVVISLSLADFFFSRRLSSLSLTRGLLLQPTAQLPHAPPSRAEILMARPSLLSARLLLLLPSLHGYLPHPLAALLSLSLSLSLVLSSPPRPALCSLLSAGAQAPCSTALSPAYPSSLLPMATAEAPCSATHFPVLNLQLGYSAPISLAAPCSVAARRSSSHGHRAWSLLLPARTPALLGSSPSIPV